MYENVFTGMICFSFSTADGRLLRPLYSGDAQGGVKQVAPVKKGDRPLKKSNPLRLAPRNAN